MKIKAIHIDDEVHALENLKMLSAMYCPDLEIIASTSSSFEGMQLIQKWKPDVLFLDISMQGHTGFDVIKTIENINFEIVFLTAYKEYAHDAFKVNAFDYLLKPIDETELNRVVFKLKNKLHAKPKDSLTEKINVKSLDSIDFIDVKDIVYLKAENNYTYLFDVHGKEILITQTLKKLEEALNPHHHFIRIHHSYIVNSKCIVKIIKDENGSVILKNGSLIPISRRKKKEVLDRLI